MNWVLDLAFLNIWFIFLFAPILKSTKLVLLVNLWSVHFAFLLHLNNVTVIRNLIKLKVNCASFLREHLSLSMTHTHLKWYYNYKYTSKTSIYTYKIVKYEFANFKSKLFLKLPICVSQTWFNWRKSHTFISPLSYLKKNYMTV